MRTAWFYAFPQPVLYSQAVALQQQMVAARAARTIPDIVLALEHTPVITLGSRGERASLLATPEDLARLGIDLVHSTRGGDVTFHAPGQLVLYPILDLSAGEADTRHYLRSLEEVAIRTAAAFGIEAHRRDGKTGAWTGRGKLAAIGVRFTRWITSHGMSLNVSVDLGFDRLIVPCGLAGERITSFLQLLGSACPSMDAVRATALRAFCDVFSRVPVRPASPPSAIADALADLGAIPLPPTMDPPA